jgi:spermidine synthase
MDESESRLRLPVLLVLFAATGCASLIYEIVWFQLLQLVIGSSAVSLGILLGTFMGGMCLGSLLLPRYVGIERHPLRVYAGIEAGIALCGLAALFGMPLVDRAYAVTGGNGAIGIAVRALVCSACLLAPTFLMGASLPAIARWMETTPAGAARLGFFYGANIAGAVAGCLIAGFWLLRLHDTAVATYSAVSLNLLAAGASFSLARYTRYKRGEIVSPNSAPISEDRAILLSLALSGFCALAAEVVWTRLLSLILGGTVYTFSIILAVFLFGLGIGSSVASLGARDSGQARRAFGWCQALLAAAIAWAAAMLTQSLPYWPVTPAQAPTVWVNFQLDLVRCLWAILPATLLWGASFPLAVAATARPGRDAARLVGRLYAANTAGAIAGAAGCSMLLIPWIGTQHTQQLLIAAAGVAGVILLWSGPGRRVFVPGVLILAVVSIRLLPSTPWELIAYGRTLAKSIGSRDLVFQAEGMNASIAVTRIASTRFFHVSGKVEASSQGQDMRLQRMLGHLPAVLHPDPQSVLVVGFGAGVTAGTFITHPSVRRLAICEIEPLIPRLVGPEFGKENHNVLREPRTEVIYDDGRHFVLTAQEKFDIITSDPIHPWVKGNAALYTKEYFEHCKRRLKPGGIVTQWVPLYESDFDSVKSEIATFFEVFPQGTIWGNDFDGEGYDIVLLGRDGPANIDAAAMQRRIEKSRAVEQSMREAGFRTVDDLLDTYAGRAEDLRGWLAGAQINRDRNLRLQYIAGMGVNSVKAGAIYEEILRHGRAGR